MLRGCKEGERQCRISSNFLVGPLEVRGGDRSLALGGRKQRSLSLSDDHELASESPAIEQLMRAERDAFRREGVIRLHGEMLGWVAALDARRYDPRR